MFSKLYPAFTAVRWLVICIICMAACTERINISTDDAPPRLVVYGYITTDTMQHSVQISRSSGYFDNSRPKGISNAVVTISTDDAVFKLLENDTITGLYQTEANVYAIVGKSYMLDIELDFDNDGITEHYQAGAAYTSIIGGIDSIQLRPSQALKNHVEVLLYAQDPPEENFYSMHVSRNDSCLNQKLSQFFVMDDKFFNGMYMPGVECYFLDQDDEDEIEVLHIGDKVTLRIDVLTKDYATFINNARDEVRGTVPIFSGPPANVETNIRCVDPPHAIPTAGYFAAYPSRYASIMVTQEYPVE